MGFQSRLVKRFPIGIREHPIEMAFCLLATVSAAVSLTGVQTSRALEVMPTWAQILWAVLIILGCVSWAIGLVTQREVGTDTVIMRIELLIFGLSIVSGTCFVYGLALIAVNGSMAILASVPFFTFAFGAYIRRVDLIGRMKDRNGP